LRKPAILFFLLIIFLVSACNFPLDMANIASRVNATLDPAIFENRKTPDKTVTQVIPEATISGPIPTPVDDSKFISYTAQSGDTLSTVANHFGVSSTQITSPERIPERELIPPGQLLIIPRTDYNSNFEFPILPDSAVIYSICDPSFNLFDYVTGAGGYLMDYRQKVGDETLSGVEIVQRVAENTSVNPKLLLALLEFRSGWVFRYVSNPDTLHPLGLNLANYEGLYLELSVVARMINTGYYAWRQGKLTEITFTDRQSARIASNFNAGSVGVEYLFAQLYPLSMLDYTLYAEGGFIPLYQNMFGDPWVCARNVEPLIPGYLQVPKLEFPFAPGETWAHTGGLHPDWNSGTPEGALDFAPVTGEAVCAVSRSWVRASAPGVIVRASNSVVILALVDDQGQPTGWEMMYMHIAAKDRILAGTRVNTNDPVGHPSCEGGASTGTHVHITRKFRGEWIGAEDPYPFILSGFTAVPGAASYQSVLVNGAQIINARQDGRADSRIIR
jgi:murein DD-endopeptidase MepM/ murein hydrolase activator NlpD